MGERRGSAIASLRIKIKNHIRLEPTDQFSSALLIQRYKEQQTKNWKKPKETNLRISNHELWLTNAYWWPNSIINCVLVSEITGIVAFHSTPTILALGIQSQSCPDEKQYVIITTRSGIERNRLVDVLNTLCANRGKKSEHILELLNTPVQKQNIIEFPFHTEQLHRSKSICSLDYELDSHHHHQQQQQQQQQQESEIKPSHIMNDYQTFRRLSSPVYETESLRRQSYAGDTRTEPSIASTWVREDIRPRNHPALHVWLDPVTRSHDLEVDKNIIHLCYHPKHGNVVTDSGPVYLYCVHIPVTDYGPNR